MKISTSILDCRDRVEGVLQLNRTNVSYIHVDVMDGEFVSGIQFQNMEEIEEINKISKYPLDIHLMMREPLSYIEKLVNMNIEFITIHLEIMKEKKEIFSKIRELGYKVGISIKPGTDIEKILPYLNEVDLVLVMSVEPGMGGQSFLDSTVERVIELRKMIERSGREIVIEVDGGINDETVRKLEKVDIVVVGSYIIKSDNYSEKINCLLNYS